MLPKNRKWKKKSNSAPLSLLTQSCLSSSTKSKQFGEMYPITFLSVESSSTQSQSRKSSVSSLGYVQGKAKATQETTYLLAGVATPLSRIGYLMAVGKEYKFGKNLRIAPFGNRTAHPAGELPHYHRRGSQQTNGRTEPGQGVNRHRPWDSNENDKSFWD